MGPPTEVMHLKHLMANAVSALVANSYVGGHVSPAICPTFPYHSRAHGGWPMKSPFLSDFHRESTVSRVAKQHDSIMIDAQPKGLLTLQLLLTRDQQSSSQDDRNTPLSIQRGETLEIDEVEILGSRKVPLSQKEPDRLGNQSFRASGGVSILYWRASS